MFNHECFYANIQKTDLVNECLFSLENENLWKSMSRMKLSLIRKPHPPSLCPSTANVFTLAMQTETEVRAGIASIRKDLGVRVMFTLIL